MGHLWLGQIGGIRGTEKLGTCASRQFAVGGLSGQIICIQKQLGHFKFFNCTKLAPPVSAGYVMLLRHGFNRICVWLLVLYRLWLVSEVSQILALQCSGLWIVVLENGFAETMSLEHLAINHSYWGLCCGLWVLLWPHTILWLHRKLYNFCTYHNTLF